MAATQINLLSYLRSKSQVDIDCQDVEIARSQGEFCDCTSNQADDYFEFQNPTRRPLIHDAVSLAHNLNKEFGDVTSSELAVEIAMTRVSLSIAPLISGSIHVMANPKYSYSTERLVSNGKRIRSLCNRVDPEFDLSRLIVKIPATWEGFQACRRLKRMGVQTLATTVFTFEQAVLAAEAGCVYIAPFVHELKALFDESYTDGEPILPLCVLAQEYFKMHQYPTRVKAAGLNSVEEAKQLAGVESVTLAPPLVNELLAIPVVEEGSLEQASLFGPSALSSSNGHEAPEDKKTVNGNYKDATGLGKLSFIDDESKFRDAFAKREAGKGEWKTQQAIDIFSEYQDLAEAFMREIDGVGTGKANGAVNGH